MSVNRRAKHKVVSGQRVYFNPSVPEDVALRKYSLEMGMHHSWSDESLTDMLVRSETIYSYLKGEYAVSRLPKSTRSTRG